MVEEIYKDIKDLEGLYQVSNLGNVKSLNYHRSGKSKLLKPGKDKNGYLFVILSKNGKMKTFRVHRLVAETFIPNPNNLPCVNHKDENPSNNNISNLEWCDYQYNNSYGNHNKKIVEVQVLKGHYNPKYSTLLTGLSLKEVKKLYYEDNKEKQLEKQKIRYQNKKKIV